MPELLRLMAMSTGTPGEIQFQLHFAAPAAHAFPEPAAATLYTGDGRSYDVGMLCAPTAVTWRQQRALTLISHLYTSSGPFIARLRWGQTDLRVKVERAAPAVSAAEPLPVVTLFAVKQAADDPFQLQVALRVEGLAAPYRLRLDGGAGQAHLLADATGDTTARLAYAKPGPYQVALDLLDDAGFWAATLTETPVEVREAEDRPQVAAELPQPATVVTATAAAELQPWLPYRNIRPIRSVSTYKSPGGSTVSRAVNASYYLTARSETVIGGQRWLQTALGDWIAADAVTFFAPSELKGVVLDTTVPPPPSPTDTRQGIVTADVLNVRAAPGVSAGNPPIATLRAGAAVTIFEERVAAGAAWYRIGESRWVHGGYVRIVSIRAATLAAESVPAPVALPVGWVVANTLNVRGQPGVAADNPPIAQLDHNAQVAILEERSVSGVRWFRIGDDQWIEGRQVGVARRKPRPASIGAGERWVGVSLAEQTLVAYEGDRPVFAALIASGLPGTPTVQGIFRTWRRLTTGKMSGPGYYIEDVTWTCYFYSGYALHTAYWHDSFGTRRSHGCVNLSPHDAWWIFQWSAAGGPNSPVVYVYWK